MIKYKVQVLVVALYKNVEYLKGDMLCIRVVRVVQCWFYTSSMVFFF